ncbi:MAG: hypothetical protein U1E89_00220 [Burkholderiaceae bacterium]
MSNITLVRRANVQALFHDHAQRALAAGAAPKGLEQAFAAQLQISPSMWSQIKSARPIGDKLARQIERHCGKPAQWLDEPRASDQPSRSERAFMALALAAWRAATTVQRKALREQLEAAAAGR